jgi:hypothetical protein
MFARYQPESPVEVWQVDCSTGSFFGFLGERQMRTYPSPNPSPLLFPLRGAWERGRLNLPIALVNHVLQALSSGHSGFQVLFRILPRDSQVELLLQNLEDVRRDESRRVGAD